MEAPRVCLLGLGEVGAVLAEDLLAATPASLSVWDWQMNTAGTRAAGNLERLACDRLDPAADAATAASGCQYVVSAVTADQAVDAARSVLPGIAADTWFIDLNSVSPGTKVELLELVGTVGGRFVEAAVMSPIMPKRMASPILIAGPHAQPFESIAGTLGFTDMQAVSGTPGVAAATKMCRSIIIKGIEALFTESMLAARHYHVEDAVLESLDNLLKANDWREQARYFISRSLQHGERRAAEMREAARTVRESDLDAWMSDACAKRQDWTSEFSEALTAKDLGEMLDIIRTKQKRTKPGPRKH